MRQEYIRSGQRAASFNRWWQRVENPLLKPQDLLVDQINWGQVEGKWQKGWGLEFVSRMPPKAFTYFTGGKINYNRFRGKGIIMTLVFYILSFKINIFRTLIRKCLWNLPQELYDAIHRIQNLKHNQHWDRYLLCQLSLGYN